MITTAAPLAHIKPKGENDEASLGRGRGGAGGASPFVTETLPNSTLSNAQILRMPSRTAGRFGVLRTSD